MLTYSRYVWMSGLGVSTLLINADRYCNEHERIFWSIFETQTFAQNLNKHLLLHFVLQYFTFKRS